MSRMRYNPLLIIALLLFAAVSFTERRRSRRNRQLPQPQRLRHCRSNCLRTSSEENRWLF